MAMQDYGKAIGAGSAALIGGALAKIAIKAISLKWPTFIDPSIADAIDTVFVGGLAFFGAYIPQPPQPKGS